VIDPKTATELAGVFKDHAPVLVLTGAGISSASGLSTYRDDNGDWMHAKPITAQLFLADPLARQRYWARSFVGWQAFSQAKPNGCHHALNRLHQAGYLTGLVTQNVDSLHSLAGHPDVVDLHGTIHTVRCLACGETESRAHYQTRLLSQNPFLANISGLGFAPDGDSHIDLSDDLLATLCAPGCQSCDSLMKPDVVFFGENVPRETVEHVFQLLDASKSLLVIGSSLMVYSGFRFARRAAQSGRRLAILNRGATRADDIADLRINGDSTGVLETLCSELAV